MKPRRMRLILVRRARAGIVTSAASDNAWRTLSLCWKRATSRPHAPRAPRIARHLHQAFHTQVHLHVAEIARVPTYGAGEPTIRAHTSQTPLAHAATVTRVHLRQLNAQHDITRHARERIRFETLTAIECAPARQAPLLLPTTNSRRAAAMTAYAISLTRHARAGAMASAPKSIARAAQIAAFTTDAPRATSRPTPPGNVKSHDRPASGNVLVWQKSAAPTAPAETAAIVETEAGASNTVAPANVVRAPAVVGATQMQAEVRKFAREAQRAFLLDPTLTERLADDVLRRVDKRLRIERERRGL